AFMTNLANGTGGKTFDSNASSVGNALLDAINLIVTSPPVGDTTPPVVSLSLPTPPDGQGGFFNGSQPPGLRSVAATDPSNVAAIDCVDSAGGLAQGALSGGGTASATRPLSVGGDGAHAISCGATDGARPANTGVGPGSQSATTLFIDQTPPQCSA